MADADTANPQQLLPGQLHDEFTRQMLTVEGDRREALGMVAPAAR